MSAASQVARSTGKRNLGNAVREITLAANDWSSEFPGINRRWVGPVALISAQDLRGHVPAVNDGIIATAGVIEGFIAAGAGTDALVAAALAATVAGAVSFGGFKYGEAAAERDAELAVIEEERLDLARSPEGELEELAIYYETRGVDPGLAREVAMQVSAHDALTAQLESEHGIRELMPANAPLLAGINGAVAFMLGAVLPIAVVILVPPEARAVATAAAVILSLVLTAILTARLGRSSLGRTVLRSVLVGVLTLLLSVIAGSFLPDPDGLGVVTSPSKSPASSPSSL
jgi:VIT1/CCC1 family predicted Fe2+/Mn2+ transporter